MTETLTPSEVDALMTALGGAFNPRPRDLWIFQKKCPILVDPLVLSSTDFIEFGWPFFFFWKLGFFQMIVTEKLGESYCQNLEMIKPHNKNLAETIQFFLEKRPDELNECFPIFEYGKFQDKFGMDFEELRKEIRRKILILVSEETRRGLGSEENRLVPFRGFMQMLFSENPVALRVVEL